MKFIYPVGATPYNEDDTANLIPRHITTQDQLNEWEQANIILGQRWLFSIKRNTILNVGFMQRLHKKMFDQTWKWAGKFRTHNTNIGVPYAGVQKSLKILCDDGVYWIDHGVFPMDEIAVRFHHRLVQIHPFPNGNGRHARLMTDALLVQFNHKPFSWGQHNLTQQSDKRNDYIRALKRADQNDHSDLLIFVRT